MQDAPQTLGGDRISIMCGHDRDEDASQSRP